MANIFRSNNGGPELHNSIPASSQDLLHLHGWMPGFILLLLLAFTPYPKRPFVIYRLYSASRCCLELRELHLYDVAERLRG